MVIAGTHSGCGKTTVTLGLAAAFQRRRMKVVPFKVGPDFIDPGHHAVAAGRESCNLDGWMLSETYNRQRFFRKARDGDIAVVEGVMGLFDGYDGKREDGSTAQMAKWLGLPVLLIVDARSMARSAAALVQGFERFDPDLTYAGVVFNHIGSSRHMEILGQALHGNVDMPVIGGLKREDTLRLPERHLGLVTREDQALSPEALDMLADRIEEGLHLSRLLKALPVVDIGLQAPPSSPAGPKRAKIGVARDRAFCFYYPDNLEMLKHYGAELIEFSPIADTAPPADLDGMYLGGGYPELAAERLAGNEKMRAQILESSRDGMPIYSECGGFMYLCSEIEDVKGNRFPMVGCYPFCTRMYSRLKSLGYREIALSDDAVIGSAGMRARGHEFHYSEIDERSRSGTVETVFSVSARAGIRRDPTGFQVRRTLGSYIHLHFGSCPEAAAAFVDRCFAYRQERKTGS